jgi:anaerobic selenocysteine-containing dehydrogenase
MVNHERAPGLGPLAGWRGEDGESFGRGAPNPDQLQKYIENGGFWHHTLPKSQQYYKHANRDYLEFAEHMGFIPRAEQIVMQIYSEPLQRFRLAAEGHGDVQPPDDLRERVKTYFDPLPIWYQPIEESMVSLDEYPIHAITQRPMAMYHSWGSQNAWLRQIHGYNRLCMHRDLAQEIGVGDDDWVYVESHNGRIKCQVKTMTGVERGTVWTWNAIGKRRGAWNLDKDSAEGEKGFLLNHLISELLPAGSGGRRMSNSDPVTGQAAWFDLRVRITRADDKEKRSEPVFEPLKRLPGALDRPKDLRFGEEFLPEGSWRRKQS